MCSVQSSIAGHTRNIHSHLRCSCFTDREASHLSRSRLCFSTQHSEHFIESFKICMQFQKVPPQMSDEERRERAAVKLDPVHLLGLPSGMIDVSPPKLKPISSRTGAAAAAVGILRLRHHSQAELLQGVSISQGRWYGGPQSSMRRSSRNKGDVSRFG